MEYPIDYNREPLVGQSFNLSEMGGGSQVILFDQPVSPNQHHVLTVGNAPQLKHEQLQEPNAGGEQKSVGRKLFESIRSRLPQLNKSNSTDENQTEDGNTELRCFRLTFQDENHLLDGKFLCEEFINPEIILDFVSKLLQNLQKTDRTM